MNELVWILISSAISTVLAYIATYKLEPESKGKKIFKFILLINFLIGAGLTSYKWYSDKKSAQENAKAMRDLSYKTDSISNSTIIMLQKQDTLKLLFEKIGIRPNFNAPEIYLNVNNNFQAFTRQVCNNTFTQNVRLTDILGPVEIDTTRDEDQPITIEQMEEGSCVDSVQNAIYTKVCFKNKTGQDLIFDRYYGISSGMLSYPQQAVPNNKTTCTTKLMVNGLVGSKERDFGFYFTLKDGTPCKTPYLITLKSCNEYTITLTKSNLSL